MLLDGMFCADGYTPLYLRPLDLQSLGVHQENHNLPAQCLLSQIKGNMFELSGAKLRAHDIWTRKQAANAVLLNAHHQQQDTMTQTDAMLKKLQATKGIVYFAQFGLFYAPSESLIGPKPKQPPRRRGKATKTGPGYSTPLETRSQYKHTNGVMYDVSDVDMMRIRAGRFPWSVWDDHVFNKQQPPPPFQTIFGPVDLTLYKVLATFVYKHSLDNMHS